MHQLHSKLLVILIVFLPLLQSCVEETQKPNILFILADDQCYNTIHELGNQEVITPTLDDLAKNGTVFTQVYNMGGWNGAVCVASRTMFNTGRYIWHAEALDYKLDSLAQYGQLWSQVMDTLGYDTYMTGKWHVKIKPEKIFKTVGTERQGMPPASPEGYNRPLSESDTTWTAWNKKFGGYWKGGTHWSEIVANETIEFLDSAATSENPFFMYVAFNAPHDPRQSPKKYVDMYNRDDIAIPESFIPEYPYKDDIGCGWGLRDERLAPMPRTELSVKANRQEYYAIITHMDDQISRILEHLEASGQKENTYIFFSADHGLACGNHGLIGKQNMYEHSMRPPMIVMGPDIPKGEKRNMAVYLQDIMPTAIEFAGGEVPEYVEFSSLKQYIEDEQIQGLGEVYGAYTNKQRMIRIEDYKLIVYPYAGVKRLFNLADDPQEMNDIAANEPERVDNMFNALIQLQVQMGDTLKLKDFTF